MKSEYSQLKEYMDQSNKTVAVTGAGISYLYGVSRLKQSVGRLNAGRIFSASYVRKNPEEFYKVMRNAFLDATFVKGPSPVHKQLAELEKQGKLVQINPSETQFDRMADLNIRADAAEALNAVMNG